MQTLHNGKSFQSLERSCRFAHTDVVWKNPLDPLLRKGISILLLLLLFLKYSVLSQMVSLTDKVKFGLNLCTYCLTSVPIALRATLTASQQSFEGIIKVLPSKPEVRTRVVTLPLRCDISHDNRSYEVTIAVQEETWSRMLSLDSRPRRRCGQTRRAVKPPFIFSKLEVTCLGTQQRHGLPWQVDKCTLHSLRTLWKYGIKFEFQPFVGIDKG